MEELIVSKWLHGFGMVAWNQRKSCINCVTLTITMARMESRLYVSRVYRKNLAPAKPAILPIQSPLPASSSPRFAYSRLRPRCARPRHMPWCRSAGKRPMLAFTPCGLRIAVQVAKLSNLIFSLNSLDITPCNHWAE